MPTHVLGVVDSKGEGMVGSAVAALATIISSRATGLGTATAFILIFMGGYSSTCPRYGSPPYPTHPTLV
jgi:hypothetical protein